MLILLALMMVIGYTADKEKFLFAYRLEIGSLRINILDGLLLVAVLAALTRLKRRDYPGEVTHRGLKWPIGMLVLACFSGGIAGFLNSTDPREIVLMSRNLLTIAGGIFVGYYTVANLKHVKWAAYIILFSSFASAIFVLLFMQDKADYLTSVTSNFGVLRNTDRGGDFGVAVAGLIGFSAVSGIRMLPKWLSWGLFVVCVPASFAMPHRSVYLASAVTILYGMIVLPRVPLKRKVGMSLVGVVSLAVILFAGVGLYSKLIGRSYNDYVMVRIRGLLPGVEETHDNKAWDTRWPAIVEELKFWTRSPLIGRGFGIQHVEEERGLAGMGFRHNVWSSALAEGGIPMFVGLLMPCVLCIVVGKRLADVGRHRQSVMMGAIGSIMGFASLIFGSITMSINTQRVGLALGLACGLVLRARAIEQAAATEEGPIWEGALEADPADLYEQGTLDGHYST